MQHLTKVFGIASIVCLAGLAQAQSTIALVGATIADASRDPAQFVGTVVIDGNRIARVGPRDRVRIPEGAKRIDLNGKFIIPGLIDVHVHFFEVTAKGFVPADFDGLLEYPRWGVTSVFDFSSAAPSLSQAMRLANEYPAPKARYFGNGPPSLAPRTLAADALAAGAHAGSKTSIGTMR